ncbi:uncharacterized protein C8R40DRAFT_552391 [Lentinula edodes]|uniref:uncharacterized protein n=1 Tax=Lentinula edodes TaxID=5353 RepID=UPI001E8E8FA0|nr:uncharacterized protein C8R40DRAFT_552391 [Lentinula edodes]KAH7871409.1 hypothetical protein C8R40DRAFT_552391 [Lentinula edodes]
MKTLTYLCWTVALCLILPHSAGNENLPRTFSATDNIPTSQDKEQRLKTQFTTHTADRANEMVVRYSSNKIHASQPMFLSHGLVHEAPLKAIFHHLALCLATLDSASHLISFLVAAILFIVD